MSQTREVSRGGQVQLKKVPEHKDEDLVAEAAEVQHEKNRRIREDAEKTIEELDDLLDEIDGVLEQNAEEFVKGFVQKGGE